MRKSWIKSTAIFLSFIAIFIWLGDLIRNRLHQVGGLSSDYDARDHDPVLSREADMVRPLIAELARYHAAHGQFPAGLSVPNGWEYLTHSAGYLLSKKLGWDPSLQYSVDHGEGRWIFEPGDGSPEREIIL